MPPAGGPGAVVPAAGAAGSFGCAANGDAPRSGYFAIQVAMRCDVLSRWSAQNATSMRK